ncbi:hypothetical protein [Alkalibacillus salilacus]|uniref:DUF4367 domain-containing protein n=1 Tax=Alkalibacillus salilacus TaxID=284582 RepID=A0ABT9VEV6_9BACI|nr:hypothetical protein [Alkalibacillus salilacus]MDQ0159481.1 hypothetical protein [Alkalibacillus salilacus]
MHRKRRLVLITIVLIVIVSVVFYNKKHFSIWGFSISKNEIKEVIVNTNEEVYLITNPEAVSEVAELVSKAEKHSEVTPYNFPPKETPDKYKKVKILTENNTTYGGSIWIMGANYVQDSNGYYWKFNYEKLSRLLDEALPSAKLIN